MRMGLFYVLGAIGGCMLNFCGKNWEGKFHDF
jgi:hypothetical protein